MKVVPADTNRFGEGHGFNTSPSAGTSAAVASASGKIRDEGAAARGSGARRGAREPHVGGRARSRQAGTPPECQTIADLALYAHGTGALPPGVEGGLDAQTVYRD